MTADARNRPNQSARRSTRPIRMVRTIGMVTIDGIPLTQHQRALVAALALRRPGGANVDTLVDAIWGENAPSTARKSVQNQVARLRQSFGADLIHTHGDHYLLDASTDIDRIDQVSFVRKRRVERAATATDIALIADVLADWSGVPFRDLPDDPAAASERARLDHLHRRFVEVLGLDRLRGGHDERETAIIDLVTHTALHPLHERGWELLAAALHLSGRRTEALDTFERFGVLLDEQLGAKPSRSFQHLRDIIDADDPLDPTAFFAAVADIPAQPVSAPV